MKKFSNCTKLDLPVGEFAKWQTTGWLGQNGICKFPEEVAATLAGVELVGLPGSFWDEATEEELQEAVTRGWIRFVSGNGEHLTKAQYMAKYPNYPAPDFAARFMHKLPPGKSHFIKIGKCP